MPDRLVALISGTALDSIPHRKAVVDACSQQDFVPRMAESAPDGGVVDVDRAIRQVDQAAVYIAVMSHRYGSIPPGQERSLVELECEQAFRRGIPFLIFVMHDDHPVRLSEVDTGERAEKLRAFRERCRGLGVLAEYRSAEDLREKVREALIPFRSSGGRPAPESPFARERGAYLQRLAEIWRWIDLGGLAPQVGGELLRLPLDAVFIRLRAERDVPRIESMAREEFLLRRELEREGAAEVDVARRIDRLALKDLPAFDRDEPGRRERIDVVEVLRRPRSVVLGDPGSGKTTLLRYIARALALGDPQLTGMLGDNVFPVYIRLGEYDEHAERNGPIRLIDFAPIAAAARGLTLPPHLLASEARAGRCLFLLDGLDEILVTTNRAGIRDRIEELARDYPGCRIVVTSRIVGYRNAELPRGEGGFDHYTLSPFDDAEIRRFLEVWYEAIRTTGELSDPARQNAAVLADGIKANPGVRRLATNPLMMTLIALTYWREVRLPRRRVELYGSASRMLLRNWLRLRTPSVALDERETTSLLMGIAFHMHLTSSAGLITRADLERIVRSLKVERGGLTDEEAGKAVADFIGTQEEHVGLLQPRGLNDRNETVYGFLHLTFEEYFTARELARLWKQGKFKLTPYLHRPRWEEPILLAAAFLSDEDDERHPDAFVREILEARSPYEDVLHRDLLLAARCLADDVIVSRQLSDRIFDDLDRIFTTTIIPLNERISEVLSSMAGSRYQEEAVEQSVRKSRSESPGLRRAAAGALGGLGAAGGGQAIAALIALTHDDPGARRAAAGALGGLGAAGGGEAIAALIALTHDDDWNTRIAAARALGGLGAAGGGEAIAALTALARDDDRNTRIAAAGALGGLGAAGGGEAIAALTALARHDDPYTRVEAAGALGGLGAAGDEAITALIALARDDDPGTRGAAAGALGGLGAAGGEAIAALIALARDDDRNTRITAARALGGLGAAGDEAIAALIALARHDDPFTRRAAASALGGMDEAAGSQEILDLLAQLIQSPEARGRELENAAFRSLSHLVQFYEQPTGIESISKDIPVARISLTTEWANWLAGEGDVAKLPSSLTGGLPALQVLKVRLRNIKAYGDTGMVEFVDPKNGSPRPWSLLLGENATGKSTFLRCIALAASGLGLANEIETRASSYLRVGAAAGFIEVLFALRFSHDPSTAEMVEIPVGLEIREGEMAFRPIECARDMTFGEVISAERLGLLRNRTDFHFGFVCGYGATRGLIDDPSGLVAGTGKAASDRVRPLFSPFAKLIDPEVLGKMLATGSLANFREAPPELKTPTREAIGQILCQLLPGLGAFSTADPTGIELEDLRIPLRDLSDGYGSLLAMLGHLVHHALRLTGWETDPAEVTGLVLIDEVDLHLHPAWQRRVVRDLGRAFPRLQFIASSHSPIVAGGVAEEALLVVKDGEGGKTVSADTDSVRGWRRDQILTSDLFGLPTTRSLEAEELLTRYAILLNERGPDDLEVRSLRRQVAPIAGFQGEGTVDEETFRLLQQLLEERFRRVKPEIRTMMLARASLVLSSGEDDVP